MVTEEPRTSSVVRVPAERVIAAVPEDPVVPAARAALAVPEDLVAPAVRAASAVPEDPAAPAVRAASAVPEDPAVPAVRAALVVPENQVAPAGLAVQAGPAELVAQVALAELELVRVAVELELVQAAEREHAQVEAVPVLDRVEPQRRIRSATAAHHRGQVPVPKAEDSAAAAETTREPAATEVVVAWAVAG
jgi:hypothetical protein